MNKAGGRDTKPKYFPTEEKTITEPVTITATEEYKRRLDGLLFMKGIFLVLMIWIIKVWVKSDSINQPVWNNSGEARKIYQSRPKVMKSKSELIGPKTNINFLIKSMFHGVGFSKDSSSTLSVGIVIWEKS